MGPGASAAIERDRSLRQAALFEHAAQAQRRRAAGFGAAADTEPLTAQALESPACSCHNCPRPSLVIPLRRSPTLPRPNDVPGSAASPSSR